MMKPIYRQMVACAVLFAAASSLGAAVVVRRPGSLAPLGDALVASLRKTPIEGAERIVELSGDSAADAARVSRECGNASVIFTIGPEAVNAVSALPGKHSVVALGIPNPARVGVAATYVSVYPKLEAIIGYASTKLNAKRIGILHSPSHNREIVDAFTKAANGSGVTIVPLAASSSGELVRALGNLASQVDAVILTIDPLLFDRQALRFVIEKTATARKPTIGFLPELVTLGVTVTLTSDPPSIAAAALKSAKQARPGVRATVQADSMLIVASRRAAGLIGITAESLGADQIR
jgi:ABC-type uncharacterized transport system substrate-binding protein